MKRAIIVHCWDGTPEYCWYPWLKNELVKQGFTVQVPAMPETELPKQKLWVPKLQEVIGQPDQDLILVGHSVGCITLLRYLEDLTPEQKIGGAVLVAGFTDDLGFEELKNYFEEPLNFEKIKSICPNFICIHSDNDPFVPMKHSGIFKDKLNAQIIVKHQMGHFSGEVDNEKSCTELPDALEAVLSIANEPILGFASELVDLVKNGTKTLTYRLGDKYDFLKPGDIIKTKDSSTGEVFGELNINEKSACLFKDLPIDRSGHETYESKEAIRQTFERLYNRQVSDDDKVIILGFAFKGI